MSEYDRRTLPRSKTTSMSLKRLRKTYVESPKGFKRPQTRGDCVDSCRPCPWVSCKYNLYLDVKTSGKLTIVRPDLAPHEMEHSCALDVADDGGHTLREVGEYTNLARERVRQVQEIALEKMRKIVGKR